MDIVVIKTLFGLEQILVEELKEIGIIDVKVLNRAVEFRGSLEDVYKCNLHCRTAISVLVKIRSGKVENENQLYDFVKSIRWDDYFDKSNTIAVSAVTFSETLTHSLFVEQKTKDAIVDYFREEFGERPNVDIKNPDIKINLHISNDLCTINLDSSGKPLYIRGFSKEIGEASINEVLAAGIILMSGWDKKTHFYDPMCGSGTILSEAYMISKNIPATLFREDFAFKNWRTFDSQLWKKVLNEAKSNIVESNCEIVGADIDPDAVNLAKDNLYKLDKQHNVKIVPGDFFLAEPFAESGIIVSNPPYGVRLKLSDTQDFYKRVGDKLKFSFHGYTAWIISSELRAIKFIGMKPERKIPLFNGPLECRLNKYSIYKGSKKDQFYK